MIIILTSLVSRNKIQKNLCFKVRLVGWLAERQKNNFLAAIYEYGLYAFKMYYSPLQNATKPSALYVLIVQSTTPL